MPVIEAKRDGPCAACGLGIYAGEQIYFTRAAGPRHIACSDLPADKRRNAYRMQCILCGVVLKKGEGALTVNEVPQDDGQYTRFYEARCVDFSACVERASETTPI